MGAQMTGKGLDIRALAVWEDDELRALSEDDLEETKRRIERAITSNKAVTANTKAELKALKDSSGDSKGVVVSAGGFAVALLGLAVGIPDPITLLGGLFGAGGLAYNYSRLEQFTEKLDLKSAEAEQLEKDLLELYAGEKRIILVLSSKKGLNSVVL